MVESRIAKSNCHFCGYLCGLEATVEDGRVTALAPDPTRYPYDENVLKGCRRWQTNMEVLDSPYRVNHPLRRVGERGSGKWERVTWEEALDDIASRLEKLATEYGPQTLATAIGGPHATFWPLHRFMNLFGSPNNMGIGQICWNPRIWMDALTLGWSIEADIDPNRSGAVFLWGTNPAQSDNSSFWRSIISISKTDIPLVVVDPRKTRTAAHASLWLAPNPGTDCTLALGLINVIIAEDRYDHDFVERWCHGFDDLCEHVAGYTPAYVSRECGIPIDDIVTAARIFSGDYPCALLSGRGIDQVGPNVAPTHRALAILRAVTGNVDRAGACLITEMSDYVPEVMLEMSDWMTPEHKAMQLNIGHTPLQSYDGFAAARICTEKLGRTLPARYLTSAHPSLVWKAMLTGEPYPVRALIVMATNPLLTYADTHLVYEALQSLDLLVVLEYYRTPTAQLADYILPSAGALERPLFQAHGGVANMGYGGPRAVEPYYERRTDYEFWRELGIRMGQGEYWPDATLEEAFARTLEPAGVSWEWFCETGLYYQPADFGKHAQINPATGEPFGFATTTGKVELVSEFLPTIGGERLPVPKQRAEALSRKSLSKGEPLTLITGARMQPYYASCYFHNKNFRKSHPKPLAEMSVTTAASLGFNEGDAITVATDKGEARYFVATTEMKDGLVGVEYGWWYPEEEEGTPELNGIWRSNANLLTDCDIASGEEMIGTWTYNGIPCVVYHSDRIQ
ncbi:MAG: molybdopterin-dependent oxidoreductase [Actinobacteria bacterium]|nr:molybdopterin-dependent oxidoreductase [Actinomycetota bacterium]